ncbi:MAG: hypothetical protein A2174_03495 [Candidatus Portnoybacteria bacterium RBG_13_41_18]|uniref:DNA recombination protein RmuC n=1 Tax=Candidatus Portnoybacteria bacterium RBG_13_41_18 TaxID=1801991 RepID=A0A1G2F9D9_9BACT|nr:MAG: hypothetical protein A2174_03495 [Candidatus Portnoybacteria bacterium RBG_13_41_18]
MSQNALILLLVLAGLAIAVLVYFLLRKQKPIEDSGASLLIQEQLKEIRQTLDTKMADSAKMMQDQFFQSTRTIKDITDQSVKIIKDVTSQLTKLDETNRQVINFADQLQNLQDILKNPKQRGVLGEYYLETVLKNVLPPRSFQMQYAFKNGEIVDAVVFVKDKIIPIDSKFSLENYNRIVQERDIARKEDLEKQFKVDLKNRIDETSKYIRPNEGTMDFAFMFIPAEGVYYDLLINQVGAIKVSTRDLIEYAFKEKHVIIVSPTSFLAYLQTVLQGLRALQIEESAKEIRKRVEMLGKHLLNFDEYMKKLGGHLGTTVNIYNTAYKELGKIDKDVLKIAGETGEAGEIEPMQLDKPRDEEE